ncbi:MAG: response regulator [Gammaproteobacteria bacterium]|nr:response regulator [Gammaproteobacteria bacterium]
MKTTNKQPHILIVEDNDMVVSIYQVMLEKLGFKADVARNAEEALHLAPKAYDLILMDIGLPDKDGFFVTTEIRKREQSQKTRPSYIAGVTAYFLSEVQEKCFEAGMNEVLSKPMAMFQLEALLNKVNI